MTVRSRMLVFGSPSWTRKLTAAVWLAILLSGAWPAPGQNAKPQSLIGTVTVIKVDTGDFEVKPDNAAALAVKLTPDTTALRVAPGERDLKRAEAIKLSDINVGDRVLVTLETGTTNVRRVIVMSATDIAKRNEADRQDWTRRGVSGIVASVSGDLITVRMRSLQGPVQATVTVDGHTSFRRYAPDSVKFADAKPSSLNEVGVGDQLRARGQKSEDGLKVTAEEVVFGTFLTKAGSITSVNRESGEITVKEMGTGKPLVIKLTPDSQLKKMPELGGMMAGGGRPGMPSPGEGARERGSGASFGPRVGAGNPAGLRDLAQMLERMPSATLDELKPGETIVVSSTKGTQDGRITAIMLVANADMLIRMASVQPGANRNGEMGNRGASGGMMGMTDGFGGIELPGMIP